MPSRRTMVQREPGAVSRSGQADTMRAAIGRAARARRTRFTCNALGGSSFESKPECAVEAVEPPRRGVALLRGGGRRRLRRGLADVTLVATDALGRLLGGGH